MKNRNSTRQLIEVTLFCVIVILLAFTPIGYIPIGVFRATTVHIPVIVASILLGAKKGALVGFVFGLTSLVNNTFIAPTITSFVFSPFYENAIAKGNIFSLIICFLPRILTGIIPYYVYTFVKKINTKKTKKENLELSLAGVSGSLTNTILVMIMIYVFFGKEYAMAKEVEFTQVINLILYVIFTNGVLEIIASTIIATAICKILNRVTR